ncbi:MAG: hypothetical protein KC486_04845 [Myxococcales bacterium]|nr:hypothetical protein [Myxococcales bacterium]
MRRIQVTLLATVALAFGCANNNNQSEVENPDAAGDVNAGDGAEGDAAAGGGRRGASQTGARGASSPNKAAKKLAAKNPVREDGDTAEAPKREGRETPHGLLAAYYPIDGSTESMPDFTTIGDAEGVAIVDAVDINGRFPNLPESLGNTFAAALMGSLNVTQGAEYNLCLTSSDGAQLALDGTLIVDNDGVHKAEEKCELVYMDPGEYQLNIIYFNVTDEIALTFSWDIGGAGATVVPSTALFKPEGADDLVK